MNDASFSASDHASHDLNDNTPNTPNTHTIASPPAVDANSHEDPLQRARHRQRQQKAAFLDHLIRNIDIVFYCQLSILYYMDISLLKFMMRALPHWFYFTPKPSIFPPPSSAHRPYVSIIFGNNIICVLLHLLFKPPAAGEATRGYLLGGLLIDFVGQESPVSRWRLLVLDGIVLALQMLILAVTLERKKLAAEYVSALVEEVGQEGQDHDSEERGMLRRDDATRDGIELQEIRHASSGRTGGDEDRERDELLDPGEGNERRESHPLDPFLTGQTVIVNIHVVDTIRSQWRFTAETSGAATSSGVAAVAAAAERTLSFRLGDTVRQAQ